VGCFLIGQARHARSPASHIQCIQAFTTPNRAQHSKTIQRPPLRPVSEIHSIAQHFYSRFPAPPHPCCSPSSPFDPLAHRSFHHEIPHHFPNEQQTRLETLAENAKRATSDKNKLPPLETIKIHLNSPKRARHRRGVLSAIRTGSHVRLFFPLWESDGRINTFEAARSMDRVKFFWALQLSLAIRDGERQGIQGTKGQRRQGS
jgi:hypothetical protein